MVKLHDNNQTYLVGKLLNKLLYMTTPVHIFTDSDQIRAWAESLLEVIIHLKSYTVFLPIYFRFFNHSFD